MYGQFIRFHQGAGWVVLLSVLLVTLAATCHDITTDCGAAAEWLLVYSGASEVVHRHELCNVLISASMARTVIGPCTDSAMYRLCFHH